MDLGLKGKVAVVTGGSIGIGLAVAQGLAAEGVDVVLAARQAERLQKAADDIAERFGVKALAADLSRKFKMPWEFLDHPTGL